jgi:hypothetical protein
MKYAHIVETSIQLMPILIPVELYNLWNMYLYQESRIDLWMFLIFQCRHHREKI